MSHSPPFTGQVLNTPTTASETDVTCTQPISTFDGVVRDFSRHSDEVLLVNRSSEAHEGLHSNKASSLSNLPVEEVDSITLGVNSDLEILSTSAPPSSRGGQMFDLSSTGTQRNETGLLLDGPKAPMKSTSSAVSDSVFETQSDTDEAKNKVDEGNDDVFGSERGNDGKMEVDSSRTVEGSPTYAKLMADQRRKSEELKLKG